MEMKTISFKLPEDLDAKLAALAKQRGTSRSQVIRDVLERFTNGHLRLKDESALALTQDLAGCVVGPADLSVKKDHMKDFGQ